MIEPYKAKGILASKKAMGQLKKVSQMLEEGDYCMDVLQQIRAVQGLLNSLSGLVLESHLHSCAERVFLTKNKRREEKLIRELVDAFRFAQQ